MVVDWGSVPAWLGLVIGATTAIVAVVNYRRSLADKQREQASRVTSWISVERISVERTSDPDGTVGLDQYSIRADPVLHLVNRSDAPIYHLHVRWKKPEDLSKPFDKNAPSSIWGGLEAPELPAGLEGRAYLKQWVFHKELRPGAEVDESQDATVESSYPVLTFTDALGRRWKRIGAGPVKGWQTWLNPRPSRPQAYLPIKDNK
jgi:hypothetical protein